MAYILLSFIAGGFLFFCERFLSEFDVSVFNDLETKFFKKIERVENSNVTLNEANEFYAKFKYEATSAYENGFISHEELTRIKQRLFDFFDFIHAKLDP